MVKVLSVQDVASIIQKHGLEKIISDLMVVIKKDFIRWQEFQKTPRLAFHVPDGVIELMPTADSKLFAYKYVNGHPKNPIKGELTVGATGQLSTISNGYPILLSEMTLLTALRTAATGVLAADYLADKDAKTIAIIGTGGQSDFQLTAYCLIRNIENVNYFDTDKKAMERFAKNMKVQKPNLKFTPFNSAKDAVKEADIIVTCTADKAVAQIISNDWKLKPSVHISALGGDCPGKTELDPKLLTRAEVVVEFFDQSFIEGEIQHFKEDEARKIVYAELWEVLNGSKTTRQDPHKITIFDSVGFALEDFSVLCLTHELANKYNIGEDKTMIPHLADPKDLYSLIK